MTTTVLAVLALAGCTTTGPSEPGTSTPSPSRTADVGAGDGVEYARAKEVKDRNADLIFKRFEGVQGVGLTNLVDEGDGGSRDDLRYVIVVSVDVPANLPDTPQSIEGVPLTFEVTGTFSILPVPGG